MAIFDRLADRLKGRRNPGGAQAPTQAPPETDRIEQIRNRQTDRAQEAGALGARMGAEQAMIDAGITPQRIRAAADDNRIMNRQRLQAAMKTMMSYKDGKASVNRRVVEAQQWWKLRNWEEIEKARGTRGASEIKSNTGWLWNCIVGKHADAVDAFPEPVILPREESDKPEAEKLSRIIPVVLQLNGFEQVYSDASWQKLQEGTAVYGIFWDPEKMNGLGDIRIVKENILNLYWEPGVSDIQDSRNVFYVHFEDKELLEQQHPELEGQLKNNKLALDKYRTDDTVNLDKKAAVIDWYYHRWENGKKVLHYCQFVDEICLYSSEEAAEEMKRRQQADSTLSAINGAGPAVPQEYRGYYEHGQYPFVLDALYPVEGSPAGYGYIDIAKDTQADIDTLSQAMVRNSVARATPRFFIRKDGSINEDEFSQWDKPFIHSSGMLGQDSVRPVEVMDMGSNAQNMLQQKIDEIKFITGNTDVNNGGVPSGVTAASAIAALKEDSGRSSKDASKSAYRSYSRIVNMTIELIRQFYDIPRQFRILGPDGKEEFTSFDNSGLVPQVVENGFGVEDGMRMPVFDIDVRAQRENAYTKMSQNELALQLYQLGIFNPQNTDQAMMLIDMMDFRGKDELRKKIQANGTLVQTLMQVGQIAMALAERYQPEVSEQLAMVLQGAMADSGMLPAGDAGKPALGTADALDKPHTGENSIVARARERAANASRPS